MKIVLSGVETNNKGAELMLYAILQEIERKYPEAVVYIPYPRCRQGLDYVKSNLEFRYPPFNRVVYKNHIPSILRRFHLPMSLIHQTNIVKNADYFIDGSGFAFGDQWSLKGERRQIWEDMLKPLYRGGCKIVFLPQAFGPLEKPATLKTLSILSKYADVLMPREQVSYDYLRESGVVDMKKVKKFTDFTSLVDGVFPKGYEHLRDGICIIPNMKMILQGKISYDGYIGLLSAVITEGKKSGHPVYLLSHEGAKDADLCLKCKMSIGGDVEAVTALNALEVKGLIGSAYMVVTSRFHGLASSLNSCVPALATSWSHKYEELFHDYGLDGYVLPLDNTATAISRVKELLDVQVNQRIRQHLAVEVPKIKDETRHMWEYVWDL